MLEVNKLLGGKGRRQINVTPLALKGIPCHMLIDTTTIANITDQTEEK
jgi:hypothetical protein